MIDDGSGYNVDGSGYNVVGSVLMVMIIKLMLEIRVRKGKVASGPGGWFTAGV